MRLSASLLSALALTALALTALGGCARSAQSASPAASGPVSAVAAPTGEVRWTGSLTPTQQRSGDLTPSSKSRAFGTVTLTSIPGAGSRTSARLTLSAPTANASLPWAMLPGRCGSGSVPIMNVSLFPVLEIGSSGRGELAVELPLSLPASGSFHVNVYWPGGQQLADVMTCANLNRDG